MIETDELSLAQKSAGIKAVAAPAPSRGFVLWVVLLLVYFLLVPSTAQTRASGTSAAPSAPSLMSERASLASAPSAVNRIAVPDLR